MKKMLFREMLVVKWCIVKEVLMLEYGDNEGNTGCGEEDWKE